MEGQHPERQISQKSDSKHFQNTFKLDKNHNDLLFLSYPYRKSLLASIAILLTFSFLLVLLFFIFIFFPACTDKLIANDPSFVELSLERLGDDFELVRAALIGRCQNMSGSARMRAKFGHRVGLTAE